MLPPRLRDRHWLRARVQLVGFFAGAMAADRTIIYHDDVSLGLEAVAVGAAVVCVPFTLPHGASSMRSLRTVQNSSAPGRSDAA